MHVHVNKHNVLREVLLLPVAEFLKQEDHMRFPTKDGELGGQSQTDIADLLERGKVIYYRRVVLLSTTSV